MPVPARRVVLWSVPLVLLAGGLAWSFRPQPVPVDLLEVTRGNLVVTIDEDAETRVRDVFVVSAPVSGRMQREELEAGDPVLGAKTVVARIEPLDPEFLNPRSAAEVRAAVKAAEAALALAAAEVERERAELNFARGEVERMRSLSAQSAVSDQAFDQAERVFRTRQAALAAAVAQRRVREFELQRQRAQLIGPTDTRSRAGVCACVDIVAPVDGRVLRVFQESAAVVQAGTPLLEIGDPDELEVVADLLSRDAVQVKAGQAVRIEDWGGQPALNGRVTRVYPYGFTKVSALGLEEQRVEVIIALTDPPSARAALGHGYQVRARIVIWRGESVLSVPSIALFRIGPDWAVFVATAGRAQRRTVTVGRRAGFDVQILDGLNDGEMVVLHPSDRVREGVRLHQRGGSPE